MKRGTVLKYFIQNNLKRNQLRKDIFQDVHEVRMQNQTYTQGEHADQHTSETI